MNWEGIKAKQNASSLYTDKGMLNHAPCRPGDFQWTYSTDMGSPFRSLSNYCYFKESFSGLQTELGVL